MGKDRIDKMEDKKVTYLKKSIAQKCNPIIKDEIHKFENFLEALEFARKKSLEEKFKWYAYDPNQKIAVCYTNGRKVKTEVA